MSGVIIYLVLMLPPGSSDLPESRRATVCFLFGLASDGVYTAFSVTRQAVVSYTAFSPLPLRAVIFCCTFLGVTSTGRYPASCPMKPGLSSPAAFRFCSRDHLSYSKHPNSTIFSGICPVNHTLKQLPPINSRTIELCGTCSLLTPRK